MKKPRSHEHMTLRYWSQEDLLSKTILSDLPHPLLPSCLHCTGVTVGRFTLEGGDFKLSSVMAAGFR